jgi:intergrase/recombinase
MESLKINIDKEQRALEHANDPKAKATHQIALDKYTKDYNRISNIAIERGIISEEAERKIT